MNLRNYFIQVDDIDTQAKLVEEHGGHIIEEPFNISESTRICLFNEPSGVTLAMSQHMQKKEEEDRS